jgi:hypothetical protein
MKILFLFSVSCLFFCVNCTSRSTSPSPPPVAEPPLTLRQSAQNVFDQFEAKSAEFYNGNGQWGTTQFGYQMVLRDSYWRLDTYDRMMASQKFGTLYSTYLPQIVSYLLSVQSSGGTGVFGVPADTNNPEFGGTVTQVIAICPTCAVNGWLINLPPELGQENLFYDHGYSLYTLARRYLREPSGTLANGLQQAADWALAQPTTTWNINYLSALAKGLAYSFKALGTQSYLDKAVTIHTQNIFTHQLPSGLWDDSHNQKLEYHGFIVSGLIALRRCVPDSHTVISELDSVLAKAVQVLKERAWTEPSTSESTWMGSNLIAWIELSELRTLTSDEKAAMERVIQLIINNSSQVLSETNFRLQKGLYINFVLGMYLATDI